MCGRGSGAVINIMHESCIYECCFAILIHELRGTRLESRVDFGERQRRRAVVTAFPTRNLTPKCCRLLLPSVQLVRVVIIPRPQHASARGLGSGATCSSLCGRYPSAACSCS